MKKPIVQISLLFALCGLQADDGYIALDLQGNPIHAQSYEHLVPFLEDGMTVFQGDWVRWPGRDIERIWAYTTVSVTKETIGLPEDQWVFGENPIVSIYPSEAIALEHVKRVWEDPTRILVKISYEQHRAIKKHWKEPVVMPIFPTEEEELFAKRS